MGVLVSERARVVCVCVCERETHAPVCVFVLEVYPKIASENCELKRAQYWHYWKTRVSTHHFIK